MSTPVALEGPLWVLIGPHGSGKSAWAAKNFPTGQVVGLERLQRAVCGDPGNRDAERWAIRARDEIVRGRCHFGLETVVDAVNADRAERQKLWEMRFSRRNLAAIAVVFDTPLDVCLARNARRRGNRRVAEQLIAEQHAAIERDLPVASEWIPGGFCTGVRIRTDGAYRMGGSMTGLREHRLLFGMMSLLDCPDWVGLLPQPEPEPPSEYALWVAGTSRAAS